MTEMDVRSITLPDYQVHHARLQETAQEEERAPVEKKDIKVKEVKTMMDLQDMKNFLYMIVGGGISVEEQGSERGRLLNWSA